mmetsp:Transcript_5448/g.7977  ORF Transcript_5448/g.7977 Transcript_5448/m.7977 type:complete len:91 (+) Transcript_5448:706-978(+)
MALPLSPIGGESSECWNSSAPSSNQEKLSSSAYHARHVFIASDLYRSHYSDLKLNALEIEQNIDVEKIAPMSTIEESFEISCTGLYIYSR